MKIWQIDYVVILLIFKIFVRCQKINLTELKNKCRSPAELREDSYNDLSYEKFRFNNLFSACCIIKERSGYALATMNCSLVRENYPIDMWQIDCRDKDIMVVIHYFHCLVAKLLPRELRKLCNATNEECYGL